MKKYISDLNRTVDLNDEIYQKLEELEPFSEDSIYLAAVAKFGHEPTMEELFDEELSKLGNEVLLSKIKLYGMLPAIRDFINENHETIVSAEENHELFQFAVNPRKDVK